MKTEAVVQSEIRAEAGKLSVLLWRNNRGAMEDAAGRVVRFGLGNDSPQVDRRLKSSDLIGVHTYFTDSDFGDPEKHGVFLAVETKAEGWTFPAAWRGMTPDTVAKAFTNLPPDKARTLAQWRFLYIVHGAGGLAGFAQSVADFHRILKGELVLP